jgi:hypothetical protein
MRKLLVSLTATSVLMVGSALVVKAAPVGLGVPAPDRSLIERVGCNGTGDNCRIGMRRERHESGKWSCVPCEGRYEDWDHHGHHYDDRYYDHGHYDDRYYEPRRYPREY